jgi:LPXTG-site transpeptidase (sortase) family protein
MELEIPDLGIKIPIVGVPAVENSWDVNWLWDQAGWLEGTAYPTWNGNSVITSHVYLSNGLPGPFVNLKTLKWGDEIFIHAHGNRYIYKVHSVSYVAPDDESVLQHEEQSLLTLVTCFGYNETSDSYRYRVVVKAVRVYSEKE